MNNVNPSAFPRFFKHIHTDSIVRVDSANNSRLVDWPEGTSGPDLDYIIKNPQHYTEINEAQLEKETTPDFQFRKEESEIVLRVPHIGEFGITHAAHTVSRETASRLLNELSEALKTP